MTILQIVWLVWPIAFLLLTGWFCTRSPYWIATFLDKHFYGDPKAPLYPNSHPKFAAYIHQYPESWHLRYPLAFRVIRLYGWGAYAMLAFYLFMLFLVSIGVAKVSW